MREALYRQLGDANGLGDALLLVARFGALTDRMSEAEQALREAELLLANTTAVAQTGGGWQQRKDSCYLRRGEHKLAIAAFGRQTELWRRAGAPFGEHLALGNLGCAQLDAGDVDAAIESLRRSVDGLRRLNASFGLELRLGTLALALAWRGDDVDILPLAREAFDFLRQLGLTFAPLMAAALQHVRREMRSARSCSPATRTAGCRTEEVIAARPRCPCSSGCAIAPLPKHPAATVETWLRAGERLTEEQAAAIAFDDAPLDGLCREPSAIALAADSDSAPFAA